MNVPRKDLDLFSTFVIMIKKNLAAIIRLVSFNNLFI